MRKGAKARPSMPERVGGNVKTGTVVEKWYWHSTKEEFIEEFKENPETEFTEEFTACYKCSSQ